MNPFSHIDLRVTNLERALPFYEKFLPELGFTQTFHSKNWNVFAAEGNLPSVAYFAITEDSSHKPNGNLIGFWAKDRGKLTGLPNLLKKLVVRLPVGLNYFQLALLIMLFILKTPVEINMKLSIV